MAEKEISVLRWLAGVGLLVPPACAGLLEYLRISGWTSHPIGELATFLGVALWPTSFMWAIANAYSPGDPWAWASLLIIAPANMLVYMALGFMLWWGAKDWWTDTSRRWLAVLAALPLLAYWLLLAGMWIHASNT